MKKASIRQSVQYLIIENDYADQRIDNFLMARLKNVPKTRIYRILRKGEVRVNKKRIEPSYRLQAGDQVRIPPLEITAEKKMTGTPHHLQKLLSDRILYEDDGLMIINKPAGIAVHGGSVSPWGVVEVLRSMYPQFRHLELAHRIDLDTSGCLILAKKRSVLKELHELLRSGGIIKEYWALTKGHWAKSELQVDVSLQKNFLRGGERIVTVDQEGKSSKTVFEVLDSYKEATLVKARLYTGRTHQIRVHAQYRKHPIAGDDKYGDREFNKKMREYGVKRLFLHAYSLRFTLSDGRKIEVEAPLGEDLTVVLNSLLPQV
jgi:23S rRNA pseudouridine955/2504/2580 synthase